jgi:SulP family sulfate permease
VVTIVFFLFRMSTSVIRRTYRCDAVHSRKTRVPALMEILAVHGRRIQVVELEGPIFFGTAENLAAFIETALRDDVSCLVLDLKRVSEIDGTGTRIVLQVHDRMMAAGKHLLLSSFEERTRIARTLQDMEVTAALTRSCLFHDTDSAIEWAEDHLLLSHGDDGRPGAEFPFSRLDVFAGLNGHELAVVNLARELSGRLRRANRTIFQLAI